MTPQQIEAMKLALEALTYIYTETTAYEDELIDQAITAIKEALAQPEQDTIQRLSALVRAQQITIDKLEAQPERHELQARGEHLAPCARHCEANAFKIVIRNLKATLAQPKQEPVAYQDTAKPTELVAAEDWDNIDPQWHWMYQPLYTTPPQRTWERPWVSLTDEEIDQLPTHLSSRSKRRLYCTIEAKLKDKNGYAEEKK